VTAVTLAAQNVGLQARSLVCPSCRGALAWLPDEIGCQSCLSTFPIVDGIPVLLRDQRAAHHDELEHLHGPNHKQTQAAYFDRNLAAEFEITRPHGTPALYSWLIQEKFRRSIAGLTSIVPGATALCICGGSGMDAEFLAGAGAHVIVADISIGAVRRARERAHRYGFEITPVVADIEQLPFADRGVDLVYVHDGLHHLENPLTGMREMARVAGRAVSINEPARAAITAIAVRLGLSSDRETSGNRVARVTAEEIRTELCAQGFQIVHRQRYGMYYRHEAGAVFRFLSRPPVFAATTVGYRIANQLAGQLGNKLTVQAIRPLLPSTATTA
jgi:ubiquinone/menaquinone biosynthesis C-methylase UbiE/uncharacterized protein YbaR (Trm112 family)